MASLLDDGATIDDDLSLAHHFVAHSLLNGLKRVDVFGFGAGAELLLPLGLEGEVGVHAHRTLIHASVGHAQSLDQFTKCRNVGAGDLRCTLPCPFDGFSNDLNKGDACSVAVYKRAGSTVDAAICTAEVGELASVFFHVCAFNLDAPFGAIIQHDIEVAVVGNGLVVLRDLVVLRLIRVEVVLTSKAGGFCDGAVECQANLDRPFHTFGVDYGQCARQAQ